ncbi:hypothetical protein RvY_16454 [Ramazzottius varieornatus]|uniref:Receptor ligand binding region domain-containing protein n=1 Tax=Ramazzottius varieornatus TaxID=947166 RepID=A0A1D1VYH7_RAMVA|nr:hypothetical protein RvY_16454 [Ramazzottius varieornatus]
MSVEIISVGNINAVATLASLPYVAPGMSIALDELRRSFGNSVSFKHTLLYDDQYQTCTSLTDNVDFLVSRYFYSRTTNHYNMTVFINAGCSERLAMGKLISGWNTLMMIGGSGETDFRDKAKYPNVVLGGNNAMMGRKNTYAKVFLAHSWDSIYVLLDSSATPWHLNIGGKIINELDKKQFRVARAKTDVRNSSARSDLSLILRDIRKSARGKYPRAGKPSSDLQLQVKAENMTNGDYVSAHI